MEIPTQRHSVHAGEVRRPIRGRTFGTGKGSPVGRLFGPRMVAKLKVQIGIPELENVINPGGDWHPGWGGDARANYI